MSTESPRGLIERRSLTQAWVAAVLQLTSRGHESGSPIIISFTEFSGNGFPAEIAEIRAILDSELKSSGGVSVEICASTIFPLEILQLMEIRLGREVSAEELSEYYLSKVFPRLRAQNRQSNGRGTYFQRMISFGADPKADVLVGENQIKKLLHIWSGNPRIVQSALQLAIRDPSRDLTRNPRPFFPCLQQVSFAYDNKGGISVSGYYPTQYIFDRAYGNYLGLAHLGWFVARAMKKRLVRVNCVCAHPLLGSKADGKVDTRNMFEHLSDPNG